MIVVRFNAFINNKTFSLGIIHLRRRHVLGGERCFPLPMFADARGVGVLGLPTSAIFESIKETKSLPFFRIKFFSEKEIRLFLM